MKSRFLNPTTAAGRHLWCMVVSLILLAPCYWQPRVGGEDIASRMDYSWVARSVESGKWQGMEVRRSGDVLFNLLLGGWVRLFGSEIGKRLTVCTVVLVFIWGAFAFIAAVSGKKPWHLLPCIAMLAYGWVFHMGFFNFYLSLGLCFWVLALVCEISPVRGALAIPLLALAYAARPLPVPWTVALAIYLWLSSHASPRIRHYVSAGALLAIIVAFFALGHTLYGGSPNTPVLPDAAIFDRKYDFILVGLLFAWSLLFLDLLRQEGARQIVSGSAFQICVLSTVAAVLLPATVLLPGFDRSVLYVAERMSLGVGVCICAMLGMARPRPLARWALIAVALVYFAFIYHDQRSVNSLQDSMEDTVADSLERSDQQSAVSNQLKLGAGGSFARFWGVPRNRVR